jgi:hypothetical protein
MDQKDRIISHIEINTMDAEAFVNTFQLRQKLSRDSKTSYYYEWNQFDIGGEG